MPVEVVDPVKARLALDVTDTLLSRDCGRELHNARLDAVKNPMKLLASLSGKCSATSIDETRPWVHSGF